MKKKNVYYIGFGIVIIAIVIAGLMVATTPRITPVLEKKPIVTISVFESPQMQKTEAGTVISYAINTSRFADDDLDLIKIEVLDTNTEKTLLKLEGTSLDEKYSSADQAGKSGYPVVKLNVTVSSDKIPSDITNRLTFVSKNKAALPFSVTGGDIHLLSAEV
ncbi:hypothetical protein [Methanospirillum lacunae]|uniref:DUF4352 domain-containing protein n=1 Tax=Methanospirillum lacunae TaxID=668570 RepID=A0A2V2N7R4_9EURY|nr:hypothetical protein [Methanospirillum lacunae]PWR73746.1 hypothetical protein DK846_00815 [Methanospirillum lacunae]